MRTKTKLIAGLICSAFVALGLGQQTNEPVRLEQLRQDTHPYFTFDTNSIFEPTNRPVSIVDLRYLGETIASIQTHNSSSNGIPDIEWKCASNTPPINLAIATNLSVNWVTVDEQNDNTPAQYAVLRYDLLKQVGLIQTNRVLTVIHERATNTVLLKMLGKEEWPSQTRIVSVPARYRKFE